MTAGFSGSSSSCCGIMYYDLPDPLSPAVVSHSFSSSGKDQTMNRNRESRPMGFTLIELLVVILIIGILAALLFPAVQKVIQASNKTASQNNCRQMALAVYNNATGSSNTALPSGWGAPPGSPSTAPSNSFFFWLLPYVEQQAVFDKLQGGTTTANGTGYSIPLYIAKADPNPLAKTTGWLSYASNGVLLGTPSPTFSSYNSRSSNIVLVMERYSETVYWFSQLSMLGTYGGTINATSTGAFSNNQAGWKSTSTEPTAFTSAGIICGFGDGHVGAITQTQASAGWMPYFTNPQQTTLLGTPPG